MSGRRRCLADAAGLTVHVVDVDVKLMYGRRLLRQLFFIQNMTQVRLRARMHCTEIRVQTEYLVKGVSGISIHHSRGATPGHTDNQRDIGIQSSEYILLKV